MVREEGCLPEARGLPARAVWPERPPGESGEREARAEARGFGGRVRQSSTGQGRRSGGKEEGGRNRNDEALRNGHASCHAMFFTDMPCCFVQFFLFMSATAIP